MIFEVVAGLLLKKTTDKALAPVSELLETVLANRQALAYAKTRLRPRYEQLLLPASYEHVTDNLRVTREDFLEYFRRAESPTAAGLERHLLDRLHERAADWVYNKPTSEIFAGLVSDFYRVYHSYFVTTDPALSTLHLIGLSNDALEMLSQIRSSLDSIAKGVQPETRSRLSLDVTTLFQVLNVPFDVVESSSRHLDLIVTEPSALLPTRFYLSVSEELPDAGSIEGLRRRAEHRGHFSHILLVMASPPSPEMETIAAVRGAQILSITDLRKRFMVVGPITPIIIGSLASHSLLEKYSVHEAFIPPDAVEVHPGDRMEEKFHSTRQSAIDLINRFLENPSDHIMFVLGGYGSGKSAFAAHLTSLYGTTHKDWTAAYIQLSRIKSGDDLVASVTRAHQLIRLTRTSPGRAFVILDGLDELPNAMDINEKRFNMLRLIEIAQNVEKVIVTVRTSYFRGLDDFWRLYDTGKEEGLWEDISKFITGGKQARKASAIVLREFDSQQIASYVDSVGRSRGYSVDFAEMFFKEMKANDPQEVYRIMARSPLYLFLLVNTHPWRNPSVKCSADVLESFIRYWLARDIEKGPSRWLLTLSDRLEFAESVAWWIFTTDKRMITFADFDRFVHSYFEKSEHGEIASISLDLQTTGIFACVGGILYFAVPAFMDYLIASRFVRGFSRKQPDHLPTPGQTRLWLGYLESRKMANWLIHAEDRHGNLDPDISSWLEAMEINPADRESLALDPRGIIYGDLSEDWNWPFLNSNKAKYLRAVIRKALTTGRSTLQPGEQSVFVRLTNRLGLHARASARLIHVFNDWLLKFPEENRPVIKICHDGDEADPKSILSILLLAVPCGSTLEIRYRGCKLSEIEEFLEGIGGTPESEGVGRWKADLLEAETGS
jgi:phosphotransferase system HPr-like phosphotransfer protein